MSSRQVTDPSVELGIESGDTRLDLRLLAVGCFECHIHTLVLNFNILLRLSLFTAVTLLAPSSGNNMLISVPLSECLGGLTTSYGGH